MELKGKRLLILGGTSASYDLVRTAKSMGIYTIVTDNNKTGVSKDIADDTAMVSTADIEAIVSLAKEKNVDGIFAVRASLIFAMLFWHVTRQNFRVTRP